MKSHWQVQEAKNKLSQVIQQAEQGVQTITVRGKPAVVVMAVREYQRLTRPQTTLVEFMRESPLYRLELDLTRSRDTGRPVDL